MATATILSAWNDGVNVNLAISVNEGPPRGNVEYIGSVDLATFQALPDAPSKKAALVQAVKSVRDAQTTTTSAVAGLSGTVTI